MKKRLANLEKTDANIAEQYDNIFNGLQKDAGQNSWDARVYKRGEYWKIIFEYLHKKDTLIVEDFGTTGMDSNNWLAYQNLWNTSKVDEETLGARGQGKFLFHYFSKNKLVLTETIDEEGNYRFSYGTSEEWDDESKNLKDFIPEANALNHQGTRIWIINIKPEFKDELLDYRSFMKYIAATWWEIIRNYKATFIVNFDGTEREVKLADLPDPLTERHYKKEKIKDIGEIRNIVLQYCKNDVPEEFRGIAIQRGGMTVLRLPVNAEPYIKNRIYGYCNFDDYLESELKKCEMPNHFGFSHQKAWMHIRGNIINKINEFLLEITPKREKIKIDEKAIEEAVKLVNELVSEYAPDLISALLAKGGKNHEKKEIVCPREVPPVRIDKFRPNQRKFEYNEILEIDCEIANDTADKNNLLFKLFIRHANGKKKQNARRYIPITVPPKSRTKIDIHLIDFDKQSDNAGEYIAEGILYKEYNKKQLHKRNFKFYLHDEPPRKGKAFVKEFKFIFGKNTNGTLQYFAKWKNLPINEKGIVHIIYDHSEFNRLREIAKSKSNKAEKRELVLYCARCGIDEALIKLLELSYIDDALDPDKIKVTKNLCDEMLYEASLRTG